VYPRTARDGRNCRVGLLASGHSVDEVLKSYPHLEKDDVQAALSYAAWRAEEVEIPLT